MSDKAMLEVMFDILGVLTDANPWGKAVYSDPMILVHLALFFAVLPRRVVSLFLFYT